MNTDYNVIITDEAIQDLRKYIDYLISVKRNPQADIKGSFRIPFVWSAEGSFLFYRKERAAYAYEYPGYA